MAELSDAALTKAILAEGVIKEATDPKNGSVYYYNKQTRETMRTLQPLIDARRAAAQPQTGATPPQPAATAAGSLVQPSTAVVPSPPKGAVAVPPAAVVASAPVDVGAALAGEWVEGTDFKGRPYFHNRATGEGTGDLRLMLQAKALLAATDDPHGHNNRLPLKAAVAYPPAPCRSAAEWLAVLVGPAERREGSVAHIQRCLDEAQGMERRTQALEAELRAAKATIADRDVQLAEAADRHQMLEREVAELQTALFYGVGGAARGYAPATVDLDGAAPLAHFQPQWVGDHLTSRAYRDLQTARPTGVEAAQVTAQADRIAALEALVERLQAHNRALRQAVHDERTERHVASRCGACEITNPWSRLMAATVGDEALAASRIRPTAEPSTTLRLHSAAQPAQQSARTAPSGHGSDGTEALRMQIMARHAAALPSPPRDREARLQAVALGRTAAVAASGHHRRLLL